MFDPDDDTPELDELEPVEDRHGTGRPERPPVTPRHHSALDEATSEPVTVLARVRLQDGRAAGIVEEWHETTHWNGSNHVGRYSGEQWRHADLARTRTGRWILIPSSSWQGERPIAYEVSPRTAAGWFAACELELPAELEGEVV